ncbi:DNA recombination protein RmuC [Actinotalea ferrariae]|uniref:DNA recombination protein RmuC n=1 Tax=Actinotalea ferrariae TaxID=1386098 RepID=UPI001C8B943D|nr:DNA recombination protein RmuC [Actinotalea ferrariae]MBX9244178.1 DNA recombination protein RmuC [Actinotalea ferrariae]
MEILIALVALVLGLVAGGWAAAQRAAERVRRAESAHAAARADLLAERRLAAERAELADRERERMDEHFRALAADALASNNEQFLALADQRLAASHQVQVGELAQRERAVKALVEPIAHVLDQIRTEMTTVEQHRTAGSAALAEQVRAMHETSELLRGETSRLVTALRSSQVRGRWGELQLRRVVEAAGMLEHVDFVEQASVRTDEGLQRPDLVVRLGGGKHVVVDAKVAFLGYLDAVQATDDAVRRDRMAAHARHLRKHVDDLSGKRYWEHMAPAPEFVVMFVPAEPFLHAALEVDPSLYEYAMERNVVLATPMTLVALLRSIAYGWRQEALAANAQEVLSLGRELHGRLATLSGHVTRLGRQLDGAVRAYNDSVSSLESRVLVSARRLAELKVTDDELETPPQVDRTTRQVQAPELVSALRPRVLTWDEADVDDATG